MNRPVEVLIHHMPGVVRYAEDDWTRGFAQSVLRQSRNRNWSPSPKQLGVMQRLVGDLFNEDNFAVFEDD